MNLRSGSGRALFTDTIACMHDEDGRPELEVERPAGEGAADPATRGGGGAAWGGARGREEARRAWGEAAASSGGLAAMARWWRGLPEPWKTGGGAGELGRSRAAGGDGPRGPALGLPGRLARRCGRASGGAPRGGGGAKRTLSGARRERI